MKARGYFGIGIYHTKNILNVGTLWRSANLFGAAFLFTIGKRYKRQASDTLNSTLHIPLYEYDSFEEFLTNRPKDCLLIGVEQCENSKDVTALEHPERAIYILGAEDKGLPDEILAKCNRIISIDTPASLNVAVAGSIIMYDRNSKRRKPI